MHWVLQHNLFREEGFKRLLDTLKRMGISYSVHKVIPFVGVLSPPVDPENEDVRIEFDENTVVDFPEGPKIVMGSYSMARYARKHGWAPGSFDSENLDYEKQIPHWGSAMLNSDSWVGRFADVPKQKHEFFIRPTLDSKSFAGVVMGWSVFRRWREGVIKCGADNGGFLDGDTLVQVATKKTIYSEYRLWIVDRRIVTASLYKQGRTVRYSSDVDNDVLDYAQTFLTPDKWVPDRAFVLDIAVTSEGLRIVEAGNINSAGFYAADMQKLVMALEDMCLCL